MGRRITLSTFRRIGEMEERMIRAAMPHTSAANPEPLARLAASQAGGVVTWRSGSRLVKTTWKLGEVAHA